MIAQHPPNPPCGDQGENRRYRDLVFCILCLSLNIRSDHFSVLYPAYFPFKDILNTVIRLRIFVVDISLPSLMIFSGITPLHSCLDYIVY